MTSTSGIWDVFISYARLDLNVVLPIQEALEAEGLRVWRDETEIGTFEAVTSGVREGVAKSKVLLAFYSIRYPTRRACQWELTAAFVAAQRLGDPRDRVLVVNPEVTAAGSSRVDHIEPVQLRDAVFATVENLAASDSYSALGQRVTERVSQIDGVLGGSGSLLSRSLGLRPVSSPAFVGRLPELWSLHSSLTAAEAVQITGASEGGVVVLSGVAGGGKSLLAEEYALRFAAAWPGGVFWLSAADESGEPNARESLRTSQLRTIAAQLQIPINGRTTAEITGDVTAFIEHIDARCLWVVDDLPAGLSGTEARAWFAPDAHATTLLTCKTRAYANLGRGVHLAGLSSADGFSLLTAHRSPPDGDETEAAGEIVDALAGHPLALAICGAELRVEAGMRTFAEYRASLADPSVDALELAAQLADELPTGHERSIATTLLRSIALLDDSGRDMLRIASGLATAPIPTKLVLDTFELADGLDPSAALERAKRAVSGVDRYCLAETTDPEGKTRLVHALVSRTVRFRDDRPDRAEQLHAAVSTPLATMIDDALQPGVLEPGLQALIAHGRDLQQTAGPVSALGRIADSTARYDLRNGDYIAARNAQEVILAMRRQVLGANHIGTLTAEANLATTLRQMHELGEARRLQEHVLHESTKLFGDAHPSTALAMNNLAATLSDAGDVEAARKLEFEALRIAQSASNPDDRDVLVVLGNLAGTFRASGDLATAQALEERVLESRTRLLGEDDPSTLLAMNNLAGTLKAQRDFSRAHSLQERVVEKRRHVLGARHPDTLIAVDNLSGIMLEQGQLQRAHELQLQVLDGYRALYGDEARSTLVQMRRVASTVKELGDLNSAADLGKTVLETDRRVFGDDDPETNVARANLGQTLWKMGKYAAARSLQERALTQLQRTKGPDDVDTLTATTNLALTLAAQGEQARARELQVHVITRRTQALGDDDLATLRARLSLVSIVREQGNLEAHLGEQADLQEALVRVVGPTHPDSLLATTMLAGTLFGLGRYEESRELQQLVVNARRQQLGDAHPATQAALEDLAKVDDVVRRRQAETWVKRVGAKAGKRTGRRKKH